MQELENNKKSISASILFFSMCLIVPAVFDFLRKVIPGQPYFLLAATYPFVLMAWFATLGRSSGSMPSSIRTPLFIWLFIQFIYWFLAVPRGIDFAGISLFTHIVPVTMAWVGYRAMTNGDGLKSSYRFYAILAILLFPFGAIVAVKGGSQFLPEFLRAGQGMQYLEKEKRAGLSAYAGIFNTQDVMAMTYMAFAYITMAYISIRGRIRKGAALAWIILLVSILLVFFSTRRGAFYAIVPGMLFLILRVQSIKVKAMMIAGIILIIFAVIFVDTRSEEKGQEFEGRLDLLTNLDFVNRFENVFLNYWGDSIKKFPFGSFLGSASREGMMYGFYREEKTVEVGAEVVTRELGVMGVFVLFVVIISLVVAEMRLTRQLHKPDRPFCYLLLLFQIMFFVLWFSKEWAAMAGAAMSHLLFWSVPGIIAGKVQYEQSRFSLPQFDEDMAIHTVRWN